MKNLKKISKTELLLKFEQFFKEQLWQHLIVVAFVFACAWIFNKYVEAIMFCLSHFFIRKHFDKQYHCGTMAICLITTLSIAFFGISSTLPVSISLLSTIPMCFVISWVGYLVQDRIDLLVINKTLQDELDSCLYKINNIDLYSLSADELRKFGASRGLSEIQQDILVHRIIENLKISEICKYRNYGRTTVKYHIEKIKEKLNIEKV